MATEQEREAVARELQSFWCASADGATPERGLNPWLACADAAIAMRDAAVRAIKEAAK